MQATISTSPLM